MDALLSQQSGSALVLTLNRPEVMNALSGDLAEQLLVAVRAAGARRDLRTIVITGAGEKAFCAGTDLKQRRDLSPEAKW